MGNQRKTGADEPMDIFEPISRSLQRFSEISLKATGAISQQFQAAQTYWTGVFKYVNEFMLPSSRGHYENGL